MLNVDYIRINGRSSRDLGMKMDFSSFQWNSTAHARTVTSIPGLSGDRQYSDNRFVNVKQTFPFAIESFQQPLLQVQSSISQWLNPIKDYMPLFFSVLPDYFLEAVPVSDNAQLSWVDRWTGMLSLTFDCKPYMKRFDGDQYTSSSTIKNVEQATALPLIHITGSGNVTVVVNDVTYTINDLDGDAFIDSELEETYDADGSSLADSTQFVDHNYPILVPGENTIGHSDGITALEVKPRWRKLM